MTETMTETQHTQLLNTIAYELQHYGPASLIDMIRTVIEDAPDATTDRDIRRTLTALDAAVATIPEQVRIYWEEEQ